MLAKSWYFVLPFVLPVAFAAADDFSQTITPFSQKYCVECHSATKPKAELDLTAFKNEADIARQFRRWKGVIEFVRDGAMPPEDHALQPTLEERNALVAAVEKILQAEARKNAGDPGVIHPRRLSNTEFDAAVQDLTGIDIRPTKDFPVDPAGGEGFDNTGEALRMSPSLLRKTLQATQHAASHLVLKPTGIAFAPFPVTSNNERRKLTELAIIDFYKRHDVNIDRYLEAAWRFKHRDAGQRDLSPVDWAMRRRLSPRYFGLVWQTLEHARKADGVLKPLGELWSGLAAPRDDHEVPAEVRGLFDLVASYRKMLGNRDPDLIKSNAGNWPIQHLDYRAKVAVARDRFDGSSLQSRTLVRFDRVRKQDSGKSLTLRIDLGFDGAADSYVILKRPVFSKNGEPPRNAEEEEKHAAVSLKSFLEKHAPEVATQLAFGVHPQGGQIDADSLVVKAPAKIEIPLPPAAIADLDDKHLLIACELDSQQSREGCALIRWMNQIANQERDLKESDWRGREFLMHGDSLLAKAMAESTESFCRCFPNRFFYVDNDRGLEAGFHLVEGFFRDDRPLVEKVLSEAEQAELDQLWSDLHFVTASSESLIRGFVWFERSERHVLQDQRFDFLRAEDPLLVEDELLARFERVYLDKMNIKLKADSLEPEDSQNAQTRERYQMIHGFFEQIRGGLKRQRETVAIAEKIGWRQIEQLAAKAYSRELRSDEIDSLRKLYQNQRDHGASVEESLRGVFQAILMSPHFCYRYTDKPTAPGIQPLTGDALATRLSYFLWSSLPDEPLLASARGGALRTDDELVSQTRRMLKDARARRFAREFLGQWLRYRDFLATPPNPKAFPGDSPALREAMFEEPIRLMAYIVERDLPVTELLASNQTFVNAVLAKHYGGEIERQFQLEKARASAQDTPDTWYRVEGLKASGRGGLFGMAVVLAKNSAGERTSPVKRGFWTVHRLLGQHFPPPPADVPELPKNEKEASHTIRELLAAHAADAKCAMCHVHFDGFGLAMEGFDPLGRSRTVDLAGRKIDDTATLPKGETAKGIPALIEHIERHRRRDFVKTLCRKFLGYALGRSVELSDQPLLDEMEADLEKSGYRIGVLFEKTVTSPQFKTRRE